MKHLIFLALASALLSSAAFAAGSPTKCDRNIGLIAAATLGDDISDFSTKSLKLEEIKKLGPDEWSVSFSYNTNETESLFSTVEVIANSQSCKVTSASVVDTVKP